MKAVKWWHVALASFLLTFAVLAAVTGPRLKQQSCDTHFVAQARAWLDGKAEIEQWPAPCKREADDKAVIEEGRLEDGSLVRGRRIAARKTFRVAGGGGRELPGAAVTHVRNINYVSFPAFPSVLMLPMVAVAGGAANDVLFTILFASLVPVAFLLLLRRMRTASLTRLDLADEATLTALLVFGSVFFFSAVQGSVWFTAHVIGVLLAALYAWASIGAARPLAAGLFLALAFVTRTPMLFMAPLFLFEVWRAGGERRALLRRLALFAAPVLLVGLLAAWYNHLRFHEYTEFGHSYLSVVQQQQIERYGLFSWHYFTRNLSVALTLLPDFNPSGKGPFVSISGHGLAIWVTTPALLLLLWPKEKGPLHRPLWATVALVACWSLMYQNSGWLQFGYRFSLDYLIFLLMLLAVAGRSLKGWGFRTLVVIAIVVNLFGAVTFGRKHQYYRADRGTSYQCVVPH